MPAKTYGVQSVFHQAAELVKTWGRSTLPNGMTVEDVLTIEGIPLWSVISPTLAIGHISQVLSQPPQRTNLGHHCRALAKRAKRLAFDAIIPMVATRKGCEYRPCRPAFLFLGFSNYMYRDILQPVAARFARRSDCSVTIFDDIFPIQSRRTSHDGLMFQSLWQYWNTDVAQTEKRMRKALKKAAARLVAASGLPEIVTSSGLAWHDLRHVFSWLFDSCLPRLVTQAAIALRIVEQYRPALLISPDVNDPRNRIFCFTGRLSGVQTLEVQFGLYNRESIEWRFFSSDHLAVTGESPFELMLEHGVPRGRMTITGSPRFDKVMDCSTEQAWKIRQNTGVPKGKKMILFASQPYHLGAFESPEHLREMKRALFQAIDSLEGLCLVVKPHPIENSAEMRKLAEGRRNILFTDKRLDIGDLIEATDVFVTFFSTTTFHALVMNKPTITISFPSSCTNNLFEESGATIVAKTADDLASILHSIGSGRITTLHDNLTPARERLLQRWFYQLDGRAGERIEAIATPNC